MQLPIIPYRRIAYLISGTLMLASVLSLAFFGLRFGIDFKGGSLLELEFTGERPANQAIIEELRTLGISDAQAQRAGEQGVIVRFGEINEEKHATILPAFQKKFGGVSEKRFDSIGPAIGRELQRRALYAIASAVIGIILYVAWAFRKVSRPISSWRYGLIAVVALIHDVLITIGAFSLMGKFQGEEIGLSFVAAILTVFGYSVNDTIVVFDRTRENLLKLSGMTFPQIVNKSVNETLIRSINTSLTVLLSLGVIYFFGGETLQSFALALIIGVFIGTYSSIFLASPLLVSWEALRAKRRKM